MPGEELREPAHPVEKHREHKDGCNPRANLHHPGLWRARDEREERKAVLLNKNPGSYGCDDGNGQQEHLDDSLEQRKCNDAYEHDAHDNGHGWYGIE